MDAKKTGALIAQARKNKHLTQQQLADRLHISHTTVSKWERGLGFPEVSLLEPLAAALDLQLEDLFTGNLPDDPAPGTSYRHSHFSYGKVVFFCLLAAALLLGWSQSRDAAFAGGDPTVLCGTWQNRVREADEMQYLFTLSAEDFTAPHYYIYADNRLLDEGTWTQLTETQYRLEGILCTLTVELTLEDGYGRLALPLPGLPEPVSLIKRGDPVVTFPDQESYSDHAAYQRLLLQS